MRNTDGGTAFLIASESGFAGIAQFLQSMVKRST